MTKKTKRFINIIIFLILLSFCGCSISIDQTLLDFGSTEVTKELTLTIEGNVKWSISCDKNWVTINPNSGPSTQPIVPQRNTITETTQKVKVSVNRAGLGPGDYEATLTISNNWNFSCSDVLVEMSVEQEPLPLVVEGYVYDAETDEPIPGVIVIIDFNSDTTNESGYYGIEISEPGSKTITAQKEGYENYSADIDVEDETVQHDIYMITITETTSTTPPPPPPPTTAPTTTPTTAPTTTTEPSTTTTEPTTTSTEPTNYSISGTVTGDVQADVTLTLTGDSSGTVASGLDGTYSFTDLPNGSYTVTPSLAGYTFSPTSRDVTVTDGNETGVDFISSETQVDGEYLEIDVSDGHEAQSYPVTELSSQPTLTDDYKTTKILLRKITSAGQSFTMGSPEEENGRVDVEIQHQVTFTHNYYIGVFGITQRQYELVMDTTPSTHAGDMHPVETINWTTIRGGTWPGDPAGSGRPASDTFIDRLRSRTGLDFDLPTEAQWEYAARATTIRAYNDYTRNGGEGSDCLNAGSGTDANLDPLGRYYYNGGSSSQHAVVGSYQANLWGLYDMHGNVWEWCLDWYGSYDGDETDPLGASTGSIRVIRGGGWHYYARNCRSAYRYYYHPSYDYNFLGFRLCLPQ